MVSIRSGSSRVPLAPLASLFALFLLAMTWVASSTVCTHPMAMPMPMGAMTMPMGSMPGASTAAAQAAGVVMLCPVVLALIVLATLLSAWALVAMWRDPHRTHDMANVLRMLARLPVLPAFGALAAGGILGAVAIAAVDGSGLLSVSVCATLALTLAAMSSAATLGSIVLARIVLALCDRLLLACSAPIAERASDAFRLLRCNAPRACVAVLSLDFGRGLRAPPSPVR